MKDQYGEPIPADLVVLPFGFAEEVIHGSPIEPEDVATICQADWYESKGGLLLASAEAIEYLSEINPIDCGVYVPGDIVGRIADPLKRYSWEDGFYHA